MSYIQIVPTVFLGLNKLLLFGTKIVTLFGQRKNVFVKQKHSGQRSNFWTCALWMSLVFVLLWFCLNVKQETLLPKFFENLLNKNQTCEPCLTGVSELICECRSPFRSSAFDVVWQHPPCFSHPHTTKTVFWQTITLTGFREPQKSVKPIVSTGLPLPLIGRQLDQELDPQCASWKKTWRYCASVIIDSCSMFLIFRMWWKKWKVFWKICRSFNFRKRINP